MGGGGRGLMSPELFDFDNESCIGTDSLMLNRRHCRIFNALTMQKLLEIFVNFGSVRQDGNPYRCHFTVLHQLR